MDEQRMLKGPTKLLDPEGNLTQAGWAPFPVLECNLEDCHFYGLTALQKMRIKVWDYYAVTTPTHFFSFTVSNIGYLGMIFAYVIDFKTGEYKEQTISTPFANGVSLPRGSQEGRTAYEKGNMRMVFEALPGQRTVSVRWPDFAGGELNAEFSLAQPKEHESMTIVIPIRGKRFYYNHKLNCLAATGWVDYAGEHFELTPSTALGNLDWGRGVWEYASHWVWASASGFLADKRRIGLNLGYGFGDTSAASENCIILDGKVHKLGKMDFTFDPADYKKPWRMVSHDNRLELTFTPFFERVAKTNAVVLKSEVHQMFGRYNGWTVTDAGEKIEIKELIGWAEEHYAKW
jgi:hypothetical protein